MAQRQQIQQIQTTAQNSQLKRRSKTLNEALTSTADTYLIHLVPPENIMPNQKDVILFHGTTSVYYELMKDDLKPMGRGTLGPRLYVTPSTNIALSYAERAVETLGQGRAVVVEFLVKNADQITVGNFDSSDKRGRKKPIQALIQQQTADMMGSLSSTDQWQFIIRKENVLRDHFKIKKAYFLPEGYTYTQI